MKTVKIKSSFSSLANLRKRLGVSQSEMATYLNVNISTLKLAELGDRTLPTGVLVKLAQIEIKLKEKPLQIIEGSLHPLEEVYSEEFESRFHQLFEGRDKIKYSISIIELKLETMILCYTTARNKIQILETVLPVVGNENEKAENLQRQYKLAKCALKSCGLAAQTLLKCRIALLNSQLNSYQAVQQKFKEELPAFLFAHTAKNTTQL